MKVLTGSPFDASVFDTFRLQETLFTPNALTMITAGPSPKRILKKIRAVAFFTGAFASKLDDNHVSWRGPGLQAFRAPHRLIFDFVQEKQLMVQEKIINQSLEL